MDRREFLQLTVGSLTLAAHPAAALPAATSWIGISLRTADGDPVPFEPYRITAPDGRAYEGLLDEKGEARLDGIPEGTCKVCFTRLDGSAWWPAGQRPPA